MLTIKNEKKIIQLQILVFRLISIAFKAFIKFTKLDIFYFLGNFTRQEDSSDWNALDDCDLSHEPTDVLVSLFNFSKYSSTLSESINSNKCPKVKFILLFVDCNESEIRKLISSFDSDIQFDLHIRTGGESIYKSWNFGIENSSGSLLTNLNADDLRRPKSICYHAKALATDRFADAVFGDFFLVKDSPLTKWKSSSKKLRKTQLKDLSIFNLLYLGNNLPHCAPTWRRSLHDSLGKFSETLVSSGDSEFWLKSLLAGKNIKYLKGVVAAYFYNPQGLSSSWNSKGFREWNSVLSKYSENNL